MPYLVFLISFPSYHRISSLAFICPIHVSCNWLEDIAHISTRTYRDINRIPLIVMQRSAALRVFLLTIKNFFMLLFKNWFNCVFIIYAILIINGAYIFILFTCDFKCVQVFLSALPKMFYHTLVMHLITEESGMVGKTQ